MSEKSKYGFKIVTDYSSLWYQPTDLIQLHKTLDICKKCNVQLREDEIFVPISEKQFVKVPGRYCYRCKKFYVDKEAKIRDALRDNVYAKKYTLNEEILWNYTEEKIRKQKEEEKKKRDQQLKKRDLKQLADIPSAVVLIAIQFETGETKEFIIVNSRSDAENGRRIFHYTSQIGKELLSAAFAVERCWEGSISKERYSVLRYTKKNSYDSLDQLMPTKLIIKAGGGYYTSNRNGWEKLVDVLLYSPYLNRYEVVHATYYSIGDYCYCDPGRFRDFVHMYGNPGINLDFSLKGSGGKDWSELNTESILRVYGYNVSAREGLLDKERWELLAELVDLEILTVQHIVHFLEWTISTHPHWKNREARQKWALDIEFIKNYKVNPDRFLIARL